MTDHELIDLARRYCDQGLITPTFARGVLDLTERLDVSHNIEHRLQGELTALADRLRQRTEQFESAIAKLAAEIYLHKEAEETLAEVRALAVECLADEDGPYPDQILVILDRREPTND